MAAAIILNFEKLLLFIALLTNFNQFNCECLYFDVEYVSDTKIAVAATFQYGQMWTIAAISDIIINYRDYVYIWFVLKIT